MPHRKRRFPWLRTVQRVFADHMVAFLVTIRLFFLILCCKRLECVARKRFGRFPPARRQGRKDEEQLSDR